MPGISDLLDSDMEENNYIDENSLISSVADETVTVHGKENEATTKRPKKRHRVTMPKPKSKVAKSSPGPAPKKGPNKAAAARTKGNKNVAEDHDNEEAEENDSGEEMVETLPKTKSRGRPAGKKAPRTAKLGTDPEEADADIEVEVVATSARSSHAQTAASKTAPKVTKSTKSTTKKRMQPEPITEPYTEDEVVVDDGAQGMDEITIQQPPSKRARTGSRTRQEPAFRRRAGSASDTERGDPNLRRKLGDITRKFENVDMKYRNLKDVGLTEANANVEKLRKQCEATTEASNNLISSLKKELAHQMSAAKETQKLKQVLQTQEEEAAKLQGQQTALKASLAAAQNEIKVLQAKLAAARHTSAEPPLSKMPGSAVKPSKANVMGNAEAAQMTQMKLDLYGDLTGLIVRSVKHHTDGDTYDCIQTGRNGTLHFKLFIDQEDIKGASYEDAEFLYTPLLDASRDRELIELMPPYLTEDITFARQNAAKFYQRVVDTLTRRVNEE